MTLLLPFLENAHRSLGERLRHFRESRGLSRADLARELGVTPVTLYRWENGTTKPSPLAAEKLHTLGFGTADAVDTDAASVPRLSGRRSSRRAEAEAVELCDGAIIALAGEGKQLAVLPAPFVRNGPPDQTSFHHKLLRLQFSSSLPASTLARRLSLVESVEAFGRTSQHRLEKPRPTGVTWNSNYGSHGWHRYVGRFPPHLVRALLNHFGADRHTLVCDPFVGSGTTAVECRLLGIPFVGIEICPLSSMMSRTKAAFPSDPKLLVTLAQRLSSHYESTWREVVDGRDPSSISHAEIIGRKPNLIPAFPNIERWFTSEALLGTSIVVEFGMQQDGFARDAVLLALSAKMRSIGNVDVDVVRAEFSKAPRANVNVGRLVVRQLTKMAGDIAASIASHEGSMGDASSIEIHEGSALDVDLGEGEVSHIITSPPYGIEAISYLRTHLLSYRSLVAQLRHDPYDAREKTIGSEYLPDCSSDAGKRARERSQSFREFFDQPIDTREAKYVQRRAGMMQFCDDMLAVGERLAYWLRDDGRVAFVIGNKRLGDRVIPMDAVVTELFESCGLEPTDTIRHKLKTNNSNSQVPWQDRIIQEETILLFRRTAR